MMAIGCLALMKLLLVNRLINVLSFLLILFFFIFAAPVIGEIGEQYCEVSWQAAKPFRGGDTIEYRLQLSDQSHTPSSNSEFKQVCPLSFFYAFLCYNSLLQLLL